MISASPSLVRRALTGALLLLATAPATALAAAQVELRPASGAAGSTATLKGSGFAASGRVRIGGDVRSRTVRTSSKGTFTARVTVPSRGRKIDLVTRAGRVRVGNRFVVSRSAGSVLEIAGAGGRRVRISPAAPTLGGRLELRGIGFPAGRLVRFSGLGTTAAFRAGSRGGFTGTLLLPATLAGGSSRLSIRGGGVRLSVRLAVQAPAPGAPAAPPPAATVAVATPLSAPSNTRAPRVAGTPVVGRDVSADPGAWDGSAPIAYAYEWRRCSSSTRCTAIAGATGATYRVTGSDSGRRLQVAVTATNAVGSAQAVSAQSDEAATPPANTRAPSISGTTGGVPRVGTTITGSPGSWSGTPTPAIGTQWKRCSAAGACTAMSTSSRYAVTTADVGSTLVFEVTATNVAGSATASARTGTVAPPPPEGGTVVALWSMNETSGSTAFDSSGGGHHGTIRSVGIGAAGVLGGAYDFGGVARGGDVRVPNGGLGAPGAQTVTISMYVKLSQNPPTSVEDWDLLKLGTYDVGEYKVEIYPNGRAFCGFSDSTGKLVEQPLSGSGATRGPKGPRVTDGVWHKITCKKTSSGVTLLVDDAVVETVSRSLGSITNGADPIVLGAHANGSEYYDGLMDEVSIRFG